MLTNQELEQIKSYLSLYGMKDSQLPLINNPASLLSSDKIVIIRNNKNMLVDLDQLKEMFLDALMNDSNRIDDTPVSGSTNLVRSNGVYRELSGKQDTLTIDRKPASGSNNPISSDAVFVALSGKLDILTFDEEPTEDSDNIVTSGVIFTALSNKLDELEFDDTPASGSTNPVTSDGIYRAINAE